MAPYEIEDTGDWLGSPTELQTCKHQLRMYENEFEELTLSLRRAREVVRDLVQMNDELSAGKALLEAELKKTIANVARINKENSELTGRIGGLLRVSDQRDHLFRENQRLLKEKREQL